MRKKLQPSFGILRIKGISGQLQFFDIFNIWKFVYSLSTVCVLTSYPYQSQAWASHMVATISLPAIQKSPKQVLIKILNSIKIFVQRPSAASIVSSLNDYPFSEQLLIKASQGGSLYKRIKFVNCPFATS